MIEELLHLHRHRLHMRDISAWNGVPEMTHMVADIMAIKATEGTGYLSPTFQQDWHNARDYGKARIAYHYFHPSISAIAQARFFLDTVKNCGLDTGDALAIDLEETDGLDADMVAECARTFRTAVQKECKCSLIIYTYFDFAEAGNCADLGDSPLWIADPSRPEGEPRIPAPWKEWTFHQYGVTKGIDNDICNFDSLTVLDKLAVLPTPPPLTPQQRVIQMTDGNAVKETIINIDNFIPGFSISLGDTTFKVLSKPSS